MIESARQGNRESSPVAFKHTLDREVCMVTELGELVSKLGKAHGGNLRSIVLYGAAVAGGQLDDEGPKKIVVVLERIAPADLRSANEVTDWWIKAGNPAPSYFTSKELVEASDVFPIEFLDIAEVRHVLYGKDPFDGLDISTRNLRHQLEYELRGKLIHLRTLYGPAAGDPERLARLMVDSLASFVVLFRHALRLFGDDVPAERGQAIQAIANRLGLDAKSFDRILEYRDKKEAWTEAETNQTFESYLEQLDKVISAVNRI